MKKGYKKPSALSVQLETEVIMTTTSAEQGSANVGNKPVGGNTPDLAGESRGQWVIYGKYQYEFSRGGKEFFFASFCCIVSF